VDDNASLKRRYHAALLREIREAGAALERPRLDTIFIGGGTPTTQTPAQLIELVEVVRIAFDLCPEAEITIEANPGTLSTAYLRELRQGGINRLSLGVQSFNNDELRFLSRLHDAGTARRAVKQARAAGFENLNLDLIFNLPHQTLAGWQSNLQEALKLAPDHFSLYSLIVEPGTPLHRQVAQGLVPHPDDDIAADMYACALEMLGAAGYAHYEISNWARYEREADWQSPKFASAHNLIYWRNQPYLGLGAGAYGTVNGERWMNVKRPLSYIQRIEQGAGLGSARDEGSYERVDRQTAMSEQMLLGLRLVREGVGTAEFEARFDLSLQTCYAEAISRNVERHLIQWIEAPDGLHLRLTEAARFLANQVIIDFIN
jgi:oxygen-independent coproporphyrinogen-3 oxidase